MNLLDFFILIRWKNLMMIVITQCIVQFAVLGNYEIRMSFHFFSLCLSTVLIAAAGYLINNMMDIETDATNKKSILTNKIMLRMNTLWLAYMMLNFIAITVVTIAFLPTFGFVQLLIFPIIVVLLFLYSKFWKSTLLVGNVLVSALTAMSIMIVPLFYMQDDGLLSEHLYSCILFYSAFAFAVNLVREIVKDIEDTEGDFSSGIKTLATVYGYSISMKVAMAVGFMSLILVSVLLNPNMIASNNHLLVYAVQMLLIAIGIYSLFQISKSKDKKQFHNCSQWLKLWMFIGILSMCLIPKFYYPCN